MDKLYELYAAKRLDEYCGKLKHFAANSLIVICARGTPCGAAEFDEAVADAICSLGISVKLHDKMHCSYIAVIKDGELRYENISKAEPLEFSEDINGKTLYVSSKNFNLINWYGVSKGIPDNSVIEYGAEKIICKRGLTFAAFESESGEALHMCRFDTYLTVLKREDDLMNMNWAARWVKKSFPMLNLMTFRMPKTINIDTDECSDNEILSIYHMQKERRKIAEEIKTGIRPSSETHAWVCPYIECGVGKKWFALGEYFSEKSEILEVATPPESFRAFGGTKRFFDKAGVHVNVVDGHRLTTGTPVAADKKIYCIGDCKVFGIGACDAGTMPSKLQEVLNREQTASYMVENYGIFAVNTDFFKEFTSIFLSLPIMENDIVLIQVFDDGDIDCGDIFKRPHAYGEVFWDEFHLTERGNAVIADKIYEYLRDNGKFTSVKDNKPIFDKSITKATFDPLPKYGFTEQESARLEAYKNKLVILYDKICARYKDNPVVGAAVMNCNPFTLGHLHLIEAAAEEVDHLVVFVVREDKSDFSFDDRMALVKRGTAHIKNVSVLGSGEFILSVKTFSDYFNKVNVQERAVDASLDATLFAAEIAPALHIKKRFFGEEPFDNVTRQYMETQASILPRYGVKAEVIPRASVDGEVISASTVRKLIAEKRWKKIAEIVPETTYDYIINKYGNVR